jgi:hypothetical protein
MINKVLVLTTELSLITIASEPKFYNVRLVFFDKLRFCNFKQ